MKKRAKKRGLARSKKTEQRIEKRCIMGNYKFTNCLDTYIVCKNINKHNIYVNLLLKFIITFLHLSV